MIPIIILLLAVSGAASAQQRIVQGEVVKPHTFPSQLSLQKNWGGYYSHICGAVLISSQFALTAAHCVYGSSPSSFRVQCGAHNLQAVESFRQSSSVQYIRTHEGYSSSGSRPAFPNDIALLKLSQPFQMTHECYTVDYAMGSETFAREDVNITGWGRIYGGGPVATRLKEGFVSALSPDDCYRRWGSTVDEKIHLCVKDVGDRIYGSCNGDSGGPCYLPFGNGAHRLIGLTSFGASGCLTNYPSVYVRVSNYVDWIARHMRQLNGQ